MPKQVASGGRTGDRIETGQAFQEYPLAPVGFVGMSILTPFEVSKRSATIPLFTRESILRDRDTRRQDGSAFPRDTFDTDELTYTCKSNGQEFPIPEAYREVYASDFDAMQAAEAFVETVLMRGQEKRIAAAIFNTTSWPSGTAALYTDVSTDWDTATATIVADVEGAKEKVRQNCGLSANTMVISAAHLKSFKLNTDYKARFPGIAMLSDDIVRRSIGAILGIDKVLIAGGVKNTGGEGDTLSLSDIWSDDYCWIGVTSDSGNIMDPCVGRTLGWKAFGAGNIEWQMYYEKQTKVDVVQGEQWTDEKVFDPYFAHLLKIDT